MEVRLVAIKLIKVGNNCDTNVSRYEVDTNLEKNNLDLSNIEWGSRIHVIEDDKYYVLNSSKVWVETSRGEINGN